MKKLFTGEKILIAMQNIRGGCVHFSVIKYD